jgi:hypothetical protein
MYYVVIFHAFTAYKLIEFITELVMKSDDFSFQESPVLDNLGPRAWKAVFLGDSGRVFTSYHGRFSDREIAVWDVVRRQSAFFCVYIHPSCVKSTVVFSLSIPNLIVSNSSGIETIHFSYFFLLCRKSCRLR